MVLADRSLRSAIQETRSSSDGRFVLTLDQAPTTDAVGTSLLVVAHDAYRAFVSVVREIALAPDGTLDVRLESRLEVGGSARLPDGTPVPGARVRLTRQGWDEVAAARHPFPGVVRREPAKGEYVARTDQAGSFSISGVAPGRYALNLSARGLMRHSSRNEVDDTVTYLQVPPSKTNLNIVFEPLEYVACRPVDARSGAPIRSARVGTTPAHVQHATSDPDALRDVVATERLAAMAADGVFVGLIDVSRREPPLNIGFQAEGYRDRVFLATAEKLPDPALWPVNLHVTDVPLEPEPLRKPVTVAVEITGPAWVDDFRSLELLMIERASSINPTPGAMVREAKVTIRDRRGSMDVLPGNYMIQNRPGFRRFKPVLQFEVKPAGENALQLDAAGEGVLLRIRGSSPADDRMLLSFAELREEGQPDTGPQLAAGEPDFDDPYAIMLLAPPHKALRLEVRAGIGPCGRGFAKLGPLPPGLTTVQEVDVPLEWVLP